MIQNPILKGFNPDPSICRVGEDYYLATSTFEWFPGVQVHHSKDLVNWKLHSHILDEKRLLDLRGVPSSGGVWAPALSFFDGLFYLCFTVVHQHEAATKDSLNYLITSPKIDGPWSDPVFINSSGFDPSIFHEEDGKKYWLNMIWDHRPNCHPFYGIVLQEYSPLLKTLVGNRKIIFRGSKLGLTEGPHLLKRNGYYYLLTAEGGTEYEHAVTLARSRDLNGPYELHPQNPILTSFEKPDLSLQKAGHASLVETHTGEWYMPHLCGRPLPGSKRCNLGRETSIQKVEWSEDDWLYLADGDNEPKEIVPAPAIATHTFPKLPDRLPFDSLHYATPRGPSCSVIREADCLTLKGNESLESNFEQAMLARRLTEQNATAVTKISFKPQNFQQMAGMAAYYNTYLFHYLYLSYDEEVGLCLQIHSCDDGKSYFPLGSEVIPVSKDELFLRAIFAGKDLQFYFSEDGENFTEAGPRLDASILSDDYGSHWGFTGTFIALACQDMTGAGLPANFSFLELSS